MTDPARVRKHAERVKELVAEAVRTQIKDPRLGMITFTEMLSSHSSAAAPCDSRSSAAFE